MHLNANPTQGQILHQQFLQKKDTLKNTNKVGILDKYGGEEYLRTAPKELLAGQTENYVEYSRTGQVIRGAERVKARSKYPEDGTQHRISIPQMLNRHAVFINNHTAIWGSFYDKESGKWGYACCHSFIHVSYCSGQAGIEAAEASSAANLLRADAERREPEPSRVAEPAGAATDARIGKKVRVGEADAQLDKDKLDAALRDERKRRQRGDDDEGDGRDKRRKYNSFQGGQDVTEEGEYILLRPLLGCAYSHRRNGGVSTDEGLVGRPDGKLSRRGSVTHRSVCLCCCWSPLFVSLRFDVPCPEH